MMATVRHLWAGHGVGHWILVGVIILVAASLAWRIVRVLLRGVVLAALVAAVILVVAPQSQAGRVTHQVVKSVSHTTFHGGGAMAQGWLKHYEQWAQQILAKQEAKIQGHSR